MAASECHRNYAKIMDDPHAIEYTDHMHSVGIFNRDHDMELAEFYEETRWENEDEFADVETA